MVIMRVDRHAEQVAGVRQELDLVTERLLLMIQWIYDINASQYYAV